MRETYAGQDNIIGTTAITVAGVVIDSGTLNAYLQAYDGPNAGKWYRGSDNSWQATESIAVATLDSVGAMGRGQWKVVFPAIIWTAGVTYRHYFQDASSGTDDIVVGEDIICRPSTAKLAAAGPTTGNPYASLAQFDLYADVRTTGSLSNDKGGRQANDTVRQQALDMQASELESYIDGRYQLPLPTPVPLVLTKWVMATAFKALYGRRGNAPPGVKADVEWADKWTEKLIEGKVNIPGLARATDAALDSSDFMDGRSRFDHLWGFNPTRTSASRGR